MTTWNALPFLAVPVGLFGGHFAHWAYERFHARRNFR